LHNAGLPADLGVVVSLPSQFLLAIGLTYVFFPLLLVALVGVLALLVPGQDDHPHPALTKWTRRDWLPFLAVVLIASGLLVAIAYGWHTPRPPDAKPGDPDPGPHWWGVAAAYALGAWAVMAAIFVYINRVVRPSWVPQHLVNEGHAASVLIAYPATKDWHRAWLGLFLIAALGALPIAARYPPTWQVYVGFAILVSVWLLLSWPLAKLLDDHVDRRTESAAAARRTARQLMVLLTVAIFLPGAVVFAVNRGSLPPTTVCTDNSGFFDGKLIGETSDRVYVGEPGIQVDLFIQDQAGYDDDVEAALRNAGYDITRGIPPYSAEFARVDVLVADLDDLSDLKLRDVIVSEVPLVGFSTEPSVRQVARETAVHQLYRKRPPLDQLSGVIERLLQDEQHTAGASGSVRQQPDQRIVSIPADHVTQIFIGASGSACS
jgi:hypothetical protein